MHYLMNRFKRSIAVEIVLVFGLCSAAYAEQSKEVKITGAVKLNPAAVEIRFSDSIRMTLDFYGENIFRMFMDPAGGILRDPQATPPAQILVDNPRKAVSQVNITETPANLSIKTNQLEIIFKKENSLIQIVNNGKTVVETLLPVQIEKGKTILVLKENPNEYFYGGGVQNGRFSHKGKEISIENQNSWTDGGVASPTPYYWSTNGYGVMWYTFKKGKYNFGAKEKGKVILSHETNYLDLFFMVNDGAVALLNDFYQLTGNPVLLPKFGLYQGHLNAYNRDYWKEDEKGILFEDGKRYKESQKEVEGGIKESLNGEKNNYQFSARGVIDRYKKHDMPFGWLLPNDGYGAGYGQTETLDGNIANLADLTNYAHKNGVEIGLWTQSDLHPKAGVSALLQRDIVKEVRDAGVRVLKTDVAWVGAGYSFGLNGIADVAQIMTYYGSNSRPFIISLDGWAGTQRYAGIWTGDQTGGQWEYIRFHIPTYIGSGLSGQPNVCSDMDGIFGGKNLFMNTRDFQWKTFSLMELNMDGWGTNEKYPHALGEPATSINRWYLKLKSELVPYTYSLAKEAVDGLPVIRALFLEYPNAYTYGPATQYQYLYGPCFLVAPIYQPTQADTLGNDLRNNIYLPEGEWIDYFTGEKYTGGNVVLSNFAAPLWKLPVFVKNGAILPMTNPNNNVSEIRKDLRIYELYPFGTSRFTEYDDDGVSMEYAHGKGLTTQIESVADNKGKVTVRIHPAQGNYTGLVKEKATEFRVNVTAKPKKIAAAIGKNKLKLQEVTSLDAFNKGENVYYYNPEPNLNRFATPGSEFAKEKIVKNPQLMVKLAASDITAAATVLTLEGFEFSPAQTLAKLSGSLTAPKNAHVADSSITAYTLNPTWDRVENADYYQIKFNDLLYTTIRNNSLLFEGLTAETQYDFSLRAVNKEGTSDWTTFSAITGVNPLEFAIRNITAVTSVENQKNSGIDKLFDFDENTRWHTKWGVKAVPFDIIIDLKTVNQLDKLQYLPRNRGNGTLMEGSISYSSDKITWSEAEPFVWAYDEIAKVFPFKNQPAARYIKVHVTKGRGDYGSGNEIYVFKVPGTASYLQGDINNDGKIDQNDLTSYLNYTGLRLGDGDFEGYISNGDINKNNLIDAYDISVATLQLSKEDDEVVAKDSSALAGNIRLSTAKRSYAKGELIEVVVKGENLQNVNALSLVLPYHQEEYEFEGVSALAVKGMENFTNNRLHTNEERVLYPTFVNTTRKDLLIGNTDLFILKLRAKKNLTFNLQITDGLLVDKKLNSLEL